MKIILRGFVSIVILLASTTTHAGTFSKLYVFGDSLSDTGNLASVTAPFPSPPTFGNRATNGFVAVEVLASYLDLDLNPSLHLTGPEQGGNYSFAGARAGGAGAQSVMVVNGPDIGIVPETNLLAMAFSNPEFIKYSTKVSKRFNKNLKKDIKSLEKIYAIDIVDFDFYNALRSIVRNSSAMSFTNSTDACFSFINLSFYPGCDASYFPSRVFFDELHLSARAHERIGRALFAVVPEVL